MRPESERGPAALPEPAGGDQHNTGRPRENPRTAARRIAGGPVRASVRFSGGLAGFCAGLRRFLAAVSSLSGGGLRRFLAAVAAFQRGPAPVSSSG